MAQDNNRMRILEQIENGEISPEEGADMLANLPDNGTQPEKTNDRMEILGLIESGQISASEGATRLQSESSEEPESRKSSSSTPKNESERPSSPRIEPEEFARWKRWYTYPLYVGVGIVSLAGIWMNSVYQSAGTNFWFFCSWIPLLLGVTLILIASMSRNAKWLHVRVKQNDGGRKQNVAVSIPLPIGISAWALRNFGHFIPSLDKLAIDELILALDEHTNENPFYVEVDEDDQHVEVFIG